MKPYNELLHVVTLAMGEIPLDEYTERLGVFEDLLHQQFLVTGKNVNDVKYDVAAHLLTLESFGWVWTEGGDDAGFENLSASRHAS